MSEDKKNRRRFLADMLFAAGGLTAAALVTRGILSAPDPEPNPVGQLVAPSPSQTPTSCTPTPRNYPVDGDVATPPQVYDNPAGGVRVPPPQQNYPMPGEMEAPPPPTR